MLVAKGGIPIKISVKTIPLSFITIVFLVGIILFSLKLFVWGLIALVLLLISTFTIKMYRSTVLLYLFFLIGLFLFQVGTLFVDEWNIATEMKVLLNRCFLLFILIATSISQLIIKKKLHFFTSLPNWKSQITMSFHTIKLPFFLLFGLIGSSTIFIPLIRYEEFSYLKAMVLFAISFSVINAVLEELLWRGIMLSSLKGDVSTYYAVFTTSIGFGLLHIAIGIPIIISLLFSVGGLFYAFVVVKTKSIYPAIVFHIIINLGMVLNGWII